MSVSLFCSVINFFANDDDDHDDDDHDDDDHDDDDHDDDAIQC